MSRMPARVVVLIALAFTACEEPSAPVGLTRSPVLLSAGSAAGSMLAFVHTEWLCGTDFNAGCGEGGGWGWTPRPWIATAIAGGSNPAYVTAWANVGAPAWSPNGLQLAFHGNRDIMVVGATGAPTSLTGQAGQNSDPTWSPDGARIAFASNRGGQAELYVMDAVSGANVARITSGVGFMGSPSWSPDGARIAFDCVVESGNADICAINVNGTGLVRLTSAPGEDVGADWSPAGQIAFATTRYGTELEIAVMNGDGSAVRRVAAGVAGRDPDWSPDGALIAFATWSHVFVMQADGTGPVSVVEGASPAWRPGSAPPPVARLASPVCAEVACRFDGSGSTSGSGAPAALSFQWLFGDDSSSDVASTMHRYSIAGTYTVGLTVTDWVGMTSSVTQPVVVAALPAGAPPVASFTYQCFVLYCHLEGRGSTDDWGIRSFSWDFGTSGSGSRSDGWTSVTYPSAGPRTVVLTVTDYAGQATSIARTINVTGPDQPPNASFTVSCVRAKCTFDGRASADDKGIVSYSWNFKQPGGTATGAVVTYDYKRKGSYTATLTVKDVAGQSSTLSRTVIVAW